MWMGIREWHCARQHPIRHHRCSTSQPYKFTNLQVAAAPGLGQAAVALPEPVERERKLLTGLVGRARIERATN